MEHLLACSERFRITFDTADWLEHGNSLEDPRLHEFFTTYSDRIGTIHFSVPTSQHQSYLSAREIVTSHHFASGTGWTIPSSFFDVVPRSAIITLEGVVPASHHFSGIVDDVMLIRTLLSGAKLGGARIVSAN